MFHRRPLGLDQLSAQTGISLARLTGTEGFARALLVGIVPLVALEALGSKQAVSNVYLAGSIFTLLITLNLGTLERLLQRRRVVTLGGLFLILAAVFIYIQYGPLLALGIALLVFGGWFWWLREEYINDKYILNRSSIIDIDRRPLGPENVRRAQLAAI